MDSYDTAPEKVKKGLTRAQVNELVTYLIQGTTPTELALMYLELIGSKGIKTLRKEMTRID